MLNLSALSLLDLDDLTQFEFANRAFFETHINARSARYYAPGGVQAAISLAIAEAGQDKGYQYLARNTAGELVARVNLSGVRRTHYHSAVLGYRVAEAHNGHGYASEAVRLVLLVAQEQLALRRVEASARVGNDGSLKVLRRNGFKQYGHSTSSFELGGLWHDVLHFEQHLA